MYISVYFLDILDACDYEDDWHPYAGKCYKYFTNDATWPDAKTACENNKGNLAILDSTEKMGVFNEIVSCEDFEASIWIGLSDVVSGILIIRNVHDN